jgi:hypothetical protein
MSDEAYAEIADLRNRLGDAESQNQALQERIETLEAGLGDIGQLAGHLSERGGASLARMVRQLLSPTQETDRE